MKRGLILVLISLLLVGVKISAKPQTEVEIEENKEEITKEEKIDKKLKVTHFALLTSIFGR